MDDIVYITGHKSPDSDSICASIAYADLKRRLGINAVPARLGDINRETSFILNYFHTPLPELLQTVKTQVADLSIDKVIPVSADASLKTAWMLMRKNNLKTLPVIDESERLIGLVTLSNITSRYMDIVEFNMISSSTTPLGNISDTLNARIIYGDQSMFTSGGNIVVATMDSENINKYVEKGDIVIVGNRVDMQLKLIDSGVNCLIITEGTEVSDEVIESAHEKKCIILITPYDSFTASRLINQSMPVKHMMTTENIIAFNTDDFVDDIKDKMLQTRYRSYPVVDEQYRIKGFISRYHLISQKRKKLILLDHNERSQSVNGIDEAEVLEIIDHHRLGDIQSGRPIYFRNEPVGSTSTIIANLFFENGIRTTKKIAGILCAAIISDTLKFKSPTCTYVDKITAEKLSYIADIDIDEFAAAMFKAGTSLEGRTPKEIFNQDFKEFVMGKYKIGISQINTMTSANMSAVKEKLLGYMQTLCKENDYSLLMILFTDIIREGSDVLYEGEHKELLAKAFNMPIKENSFYLPGVVSRKKQVVPPLSMAAE